VTSRTIQRFLGDERGAAILEATVVIPTILAFGLGALEFGNVFYNYHLIQTGVRDATRYLARVDDGCTTGSASQGYAKTIAVYGHTDKSLGKKRVSWWDTDKVTIPTCAVSGVTGLRTASVKTVSVVANPTYADLGFLGYFNIGQMTITISHSERFIGE
jgi:Flp pilus assembly protein TadG